MNLESVQSRTPHDLRTKVIARGSCSAARVGRPRLFVTLAVPGGAAILLAAGILFFFFAHQAARQKAQSASKPELLTPFESRASVTRNDYLNLGAYFENGFLAYRDPDASSASYPGLHSSHGRRMDSIEGFTRMAPLLAVCLRSANGTSAFQPDQARQALLDGWVNGTNPASAGYWGAIHDNDQRIVEAADVALSIWLLRDSLWQQLSPDARERVFRWLLQVNHRQVPDNNWHLFVTYVDVVASALGYPADMNEARQHFDRFRSFYAGDGWFSDGPGKRFDYYNAWGIDYQLFWIDQADPGFAAGFIQKTIDTFAQNLTYLVGPEGLPIMARSLCYRMAVVAPLVLDQALPHPSVSAGEARRALRRTWTYFIQNDGVANGAISQGYCGFDPRLVDNYSGPASCLWGLRSLIVAFYLRPDSQFWIAPEEPLPVEQANYTVTIPAIGWTIEGRRPDKIVIHTGSTISSAKLEQEPVWWAVLDTLLGKAHRPENMSAKYNLAAYRSDHPFCGCAHGQ